MRQFSLASTHRDEVLHYAQKLPLKNGFGVVGVSGQGVPVAIVASVAASRGVRDEIQISRSETGMPSLWGV